MDKWTHVLKQFLSLQGCLNRSDADVMVLELIAILDSFCCPLAIVIDASIDCYAS